MNNFCPFINGQCRPDCKFKSHNTTISSGESKISDCLIVIKLDEINGYQYDQLTDISNAMKNT